MAAKKTTATKAPASKVEAVKAPVAKAVEKKEPAKKAPVKKAAAKKAEAKATYTSEQIYSMIEQAAYFAAVNDGFKKDPTAYWTQAEGEVNAKIKG